MIILDFFDGLIAIEISLSSNTFDNYFLFFTIELARRGGRLLRDSSKFCVVVRSYKVVAKSVRALEAAEDGVVAAFELVLTPALFAFIGYL